MGQVLTILLVVLLGLAISRMVVQVPLGGYNCMMRDAGGKCDR